VFAVLIACLGLFGLASFTTLRRAKEIGIRKVLGASVQGITLLLSKEFMGLVLLANLMAWPIVYFSLNAWLRKFAYRTNMGIWIFAAAGFLSLAIALLAVSYQSIKAALTNPGDSLKYE
jgi:putative ABC transport system permease protein